MSDESRHEVPVNIEQVVAGLFELGAALGPSAEAVLPAVRDDLLKAVAARDRGDPNRAVEHIAAAMGRLASATEKLDLAEAALMRVVLGRFRAALMRWDEAGAKGLADTMLDRSGGRVKGS